MQSGLSFCGAIPMYAQGVDASAQALNVLDPQRTGAVDMNTLSRLMNKLHKTGPVSRGDSLHTFHA